MTFVNLPSFADMVDTSTGAGAWSAAAFTEFLPMMWWPIGIMAGALILSWLFSHLKTIRDYLVSHFTHYQIDEKPNLTWKEKRAIFGDMQEMIDEDNLKRKINRLSYLSGEFKDFDHYRGYSS